MHVCTYVIHNFMYEWDSTARHCSTSPHGNALRCCVGWAELVLPFSWFYVVLRTFVWYLVCSCWAELLGCDLCPLCYIPGILYVCWYFVTSYFVWYRVSWSKRGKGVRVLYISLRSDCFSIRIRAEKIIFLIVFQFCCSDSLYVGLSVWAAISFSFQLLFESVSSLKDRYFDVIPALGKK